ncbi:MAG TPA: prenyltransferase, partial [Nitrososphaerales archaeon]|nr:prenyltransferase [Nitrososphaerales archaeon]
GTYYIQTHSLSLEPLIAGIPLGILTAGILYVNEFPDMDADKSRGRNHLVARWGKAKAARNLKPILAAAYLVPVVGVLLGLVSPFSLLLLIAVPKAITTSRLVSRNYDKVMELIPGMASMVMTTLLTGVLMFGGYVASGLV